MKIKYHKPTFKIVEFAAEQGFATSTFRRERDSQQFVMDLLEGEARAQQYQTDDWTASDPVDDGNHFTVDDWGSM